MSTTDDASPLEPAPAAASPEDRAETAGAREPAASAADELGPSLVDTLSPAVRRLVRQFDLDITGIHGSGPAGRIRVSDVMGLLEGRTDSGARDAPRAAPSSEDTVIEPSSASAASDRDEGAPIEAPPQPPTASPSTTVFDCDLSRVLSHRKRLRENGVEILLTSYALTALADALEQASEVAAASGVRFGVWLTTSEGEQRSALVDAARIPRGTLDDRLRGFDATLRQNLDSDTLGADLLVHHYGESGSLLATPTPLGAGHAMSVGIGRVRREIVVRTTDGVEAPRVAARCYLSLSFHTDRVAFHRANQFMARATRVLEQWPE